MVLGYSSPANAMILLTADKDFGELIAPGLRKQPQ